MKRDIKTFRSYFDDFMQSLGDKEQAKVLYCLRVLALAERPSQRFVKHIRDGLFELRVEWASNIYRVFFIFDQGNIVVLFNGFAKKTQKTPPSEIEKALRIRAEYYKETYG